MNLDLIETEASQTDLVRWLDSRLHQEGLTQTELVAWLNRVLNWLQRERRYSLTVLVRHRNRLADTLAERLKTLRAGAQARGLQLTLFGPDPRGCVSAAYTFRFAPGRYPARPPYYEGRYRFTKHYYGVIGDLKSSGEEFDCAVAIDELPEVRHWVRNLPRYPEFSFWLPTASDNFYPDFVCELHDGRLLVVEYKGEAYKSNDDSAEKRVLGEYWAKVSGDLFLMAVERDVAGRGVTGQIQAILGSARALRRTDIAELDLVRVVRECEADGRRLQTSQVGTVVFVHEGGEAFEVEFIDTDNRSWVVTLAAIQVEKATAQ
jgi:type III restriction enzyme